MRSPVASRLKKALSSLCAALLCCSLIPTTALASQDSLSLIPEGDGGAVSIPSGAEGGGDDVLALRSEAAPSVDGGGAVTSSENVSDTAADAAEDSKDADAFSTIQRGDESPRYEDRATPDGFQDDSVATGSILSDGEEGTRDDVAVDDDTQATVPAADVINQTMPLEVVAQQESTRSYFLAQTLESTNTVPIVSANLPLDESTNQGPQAGADGGEGSSEGEGDDDSDESDLDTSDGAFVVTPGVSSESTVVGSFIYLGMTFAVEPGGESVALVAVDYSKLPEEFVEKQVLVIPDAATPDGMDYYSVTRIAANAFSSLTKENADPDYTGCIELFSDEELLAEAGISQEEVQGLLSAEAADSDDLEPSDDIRTIVSMDGNVATLDDGSTYTFTNPLGGCAGILALGIPASVTCIEDDVFAGSDTLQYVVVSEDNPEYASFDGALYSADLSKLRFVPEGRVGTVRIASGATSADPEVFSHCPSVDILVADAENDGYTDKYRGANGGMLIIGALENEKETKSRIVIQAVQVLNRRAYTPLKVQGSLFEARNASQAGTTIRTFSTLRIFARETVYFQWNAVRSSLTATGGTYLRLEGDTLNERHALTGLTFIPDRNAAAVGFMDDSTHGAAVAWTFANSSFSIWDSTDLEGGITRVTVQNKDAYRDKTARDLTTYDCVVSIPSDGLVEAWINGYTSFLELSEEYLPNGGSWATVSDHAVDAGDSKLFEHVGTHYGYAGSKRDVTVRPAPENGPAGSPVFVGWRCINDGKTYKPGDVIANTGELLRFEAQWSSSFTLKWDKNTTDISVGGMPEEGSIAATASGTSAVNATGLKSLYSSVAALPATPVRTGYVFAGWYLDAGCTQRITAAVLSRKIVSSSYSSSDAASCIKADVDGSVRLYAGWAIPYDNLKIYANESVYVVWNSEVCSFDATTGANHRILSSQLESRQASRRVDRLRLYQADGRLSVIVPAFPDPTDSYGASTLYVSETVNGGIGRFSLQDSTALRDKTVRAYDFDVLVNLRADSKARLWLNDYKYQMWLSEEYLPNGGTWATVDANATSPDDSKYYEHEGKTYDGTTSTTVTVKAAPDNVPADKPVFTGWKCLDDGKVYLPGDVIADVKQPLRFEAQWSESFSLKWDANGHDVWPSGIASDDVSSMPSDATVAAYGVGSAAINVRGLKSLYPSEAELPSTPVREGRLFAGWYLDAACTARVTDAVLSRAIVSSSYSGSDAADCLKAASDGSLTLYAGWALPYRNLTVFSDERLYVSWNANVAAMDATGGAPYRIMGNTIDPDAEPIVYDLEMSGTRLLVSAPSAWKDQTAPGVSFCYANANPLTGVSASDSGVRSVLLQDSRAYRDKTVHALVRAELAPDSEAKAWINDYRYSMWLSEEYLPGEGATWAGVDANATSADDSKYYEHEGRTYDGTTSVTVTVREAPENAPEDRPVFLGWRCRLMDGTYMEGLLQPGDEIEGVSEPLVFEAVWTDIYNVAVPLLVGVALDPATGEVRVSEGAALSTTNPAQVKVVSLEYDLVEETDDLDGKGEASVAGGGTYRVFSDEEGASHLDEVSLTVLAGEAVGGDGRDDEVPLEVPLSAPCRLDDADALAAAGFIPFGADAGDLQLEYGLRFSLEGDALTDMLGRLNLPEKDGLDGASSESFPIAKLFYTIAMA